MATDEVKSTTYRLNGLEPDNLLAFLALLGLLRALDRARPEWEPRAYWEGEPPRAVLVLAADNISHDDLMVGVEQGVRELGEVYKFDKPNITFSSQDFRQILESAQGNMDRRVLLAALASDGVLKRDKDVVAPTPLCAMFGQGHQDFLSRLEKAVLPCNQSQLQNISRALFKSWKYEDKTESFRWDPIEDRRYALQFGDPSKNKLGTEAGANRLAAIGFGLLACVPTSSGLSTLGVSGQRREQDICWPLFRVPISLAGFLAFLGHPDIGSEKDAPRLAAYGIVGIARARRYQVGKYFNFERARVQFFEKEKQCNGFFMSSLVYLNTLNCRQNYSSRHF